MASTFLEGQMRRMLRAWAAAFAIALVACGPSLSDTQRLWCKDNDMVYIGVLDAPVLDAASDLGIDIPDLVRRAALEAGLVNISGGTYQADYAKIDGWGTALDQWRATPGYTRACIAAFEKR